MSLVILGQSGGPTQLSANDDVIGVMTQVPEGAVKHSEGGLTNADGSTAFGTPFNLLAYASHSTTYAAQSTTVTFTTSGMPYKLRILGAKVRCIANRSEDFQKGYGFIRVEIEDGDGALDDDGDDDSTWTGVLCLENVGDMEAGDVREVAVVEPTLSVVDADEGLRVKVTSKADSFGTNPTASFAVELQCLRVI